MGIIFSISGVRGRVPDELTPDIMVQLGKSIGTYFHGDILIGRDGRRSSQLLEHALISGILLTGSNIRIGGIVPTPTLIYNTHELDVAGGIMITASHNPELWNGVKFIHPDGRFLLPQEVEKLKQIYRQNEYHIASWDKFGTISYDHHMIERHIRRILEIVDTKSISRGHFKVVVDGLNSAFGLAATKLLDLLNVDHICINCEPGRGFNRLPEPIPQHLADLSQAVLKYKADLGITSDADGDRLSIVTDRGIPIGEEYTLPLVAHHLCKSRQGPIVTNLSTSQMIEHIASPIIRTPVGEAHVVAKMLETRAILGGEGNGGIIDPQLHYTRDALIGTARILELLAHEGCKISEIVAQFPYYCMIKDKLPISSEIPKDKLIAYLKPDTVREDDGLWLRRDRIMVHVRPSNTEPIIRIVVETPDDQTTSRILQDIKEIVGPQCAA